MPDDRNKGTLEDIYRMVTPVDLIGSRRVARVPAEQDLIRQLLEILINVDSQGLYRLEKLKEKIDQIFTSKDYESADVSVTKNQLQHVIRLYSTAGFLNNAGAFTLKYKDPQTQEVQDITKFEQIVGVGTNEQLGLVDQARISNPRLEIGCVLCTSPYFHPGMRNAEKVEIFLNAMPSYIMSRCVPYMDVRFAFDRPLTKSPYQLKAPSLLKFLEGPKEVAEGSADRGMFAATSHYDAENEDSDNKRQISVAGMELFTSPQTLVNIGAGDTGRYVEVADPFRPFMSLNSVEIKVVPSGAGFFTYKTATVSITLHDRTRLTEISDLIRPQIYTNTTIWLTYGWRHPRETDNPYADFINNNMLMREAYGIKNSSFSFDEVGQVKISLELWTKGTSELRDVRIQDSSVHMLFKTLEQFAERIRQLRQQLGLTPREGLNSEVRAYQVLDAASAGVFPDMTPQEAKNAMEKMWKALNAAQAENQNINGEAVTELKEMITGLIQPQGKKFAYKEAIKTSASNVVKGKFREAMQGPDPFIPFEDKYNDMDGNYTEQYKPTMLLNVISRFQSKDDKISSNLNKELGGADKKLVSLGKLFMVFLTGAAPSLDTVDEIQVFFYQLNDDCGPVSAMNIAEFPIEMARFMYEYREHVINRGGESLTLEEFLSVLMTQVSDDMRSVAYGLREFYEPFDPDEPDPKMKKDAQGELESQIAVLERKYGRFKKPALQVYIETIHATDNTRTGQMDLLDMHELANMLPTEENKASDIVKITRIHVYDKQVDPHKFEASVFNRKEGTIKVKPEDTEKQKVTNQNTPKPDGVDEIPGLRWNEEEHIVEFDDDQPVSNQVIKDLVSVRVPTIRYGGNATLVTNAAVSSQADALLGTVQMLGAPSKPNSTQPGGSGAGGLPLRIIPATLTAQSMGCPLLSLAQYYFWDFSTGTTVDNLYILTGLTHTFEPGKFDTGMTFGYHDAYGKYEQSPQHLLTDMKRQLDMQPETEQEG